MLAFLFLAENAEKSFSNTGLSGCAGELTALPQTFLPKERIGKGTDDRIPPRF